MPCVGVLVEGQADHDRPRRFMKRSAAYTVVRRGIYEWVRRNAIVRMLPAHTPAQKLPPDPEPHLHAAGTLPPIELPGLRFEDPRRRDNYGRIGAMRVAPMFPVEEKLHG